MNPTNRGRHRTAVETATSTAVFAILGGLLVSVLVLTQGCKRCGADPNAVAELIEVNTNALTQHTETGEWVAAAKGDSYAYGDAIRTKQNGSASVQLTGSKRVIKLGPGATIRFRRPVNVAVGAAQLEGSGDIEIGTMRLRLGDGAKIDLSGVEGSENVSVAFGTIEFDQNGQRIEIGEGGILRVAFGQIEVDQPVPAVVDAGIPVVVDAARPAPVDAAPAAPALSIQIVGDGASVIRNGRPVALPAGAAALEPGAIVRLRQGTRMDLARGSQRVTAFGAGDFVVAPNESSLLSARSGRAEAETPAGVDTRVDVPGGYLILKGVETGTAAGVALTPRGTDVNVTRGQADIHGAGGGSVSFRQGMRGTLTRAGEVEGSGGEAVGAGGIPATGPIISTSAMGISAGDSAQIHDARAPTDVRINIASSCPGEAIAEIVGAPRQQAGKSARASGSVILRFGPGSNRYRVTCITGETLANAPAASGTINVARDSGEKAYPRLPPVNRVEMNGRTFRSIYENQLPEFIFVWPDAPSDSGNTLHINPRGGGSAKRLPGGATIRTASGDVDDGTYTVFFEGGGRRSPETTLIVDFNNSTPAGYIAEPRNGVVPAGNVRVRGAALEGSTVTVNGSPAPLDGQRRFSVEVVPPSGEALAIRIVSPGRGIHYYLRHLGGAQ